MWKAELAVVIIIMLNIFSPVLAAGKIAFSSNREESFDIYIMDEDGRNIENITEHPAADSGPSWSPDGSMIVFRRSLFGKYGIYIVRVDEGDLTQVTNGADYFPLFSPDGTKIALIETKVIDPDFLLSVVDINGENKNRLRILHSLNDRPHTWSPDGKKIAFCDSGNVYIVDVDSGNWEKITCTAPDGTEICAVDIDWSPEGGKLAIAAIGDTQGIWIANCDGSDARRITEHRDRCPEWSPNGTKIAFHSLRGGNQDIYIMDSDGQNITRLTENTAFDGQPSWFAQTDSIQSRGSLVTTWGKLRSLYY